MPQQFHTLSPFPGGNDQYFHTLLAALTWAQQTPHPTREQLAQWFVEHFAVGVSSTPIYIQMLTRLETVTIDGLDRVTLTPFGSALLAAEVEAGKRMLLDDLLARCVGLADMLAVYGAANEPLHVAQVADALHERFPKWTHLTPYQHRSLWLLSLDGLAQVKGRYYRITERGRELLESHQPQQKTALPLASSETAALIRELNAAVVDSRNPNRLQQVVARAFVHLGYAVEERGGPGDTDIVVTAGIGPEGYTVIVDTKARSDGRLVDLSAYTLHEHRQKNTADYVVVLAGSFGGGKVVRQAEAQQIVLLPAAVLIGWLRLHDQTPLNLRVYRAMLTQPGLVAELAPALLAAAQERRLPTHAFVTYAGIGAFISNRSFPVCREELEVFLGGA